MSFHTPRSLPLAVLALALGALLLAPASRARADDFWVLGATLDGQSYPARGASFGAGPTLFVERANGSPTGAVGGRLSLGLDAVNGEPRGDLSLTLQTYFVALRLGAGVRAGRFWPEDSRRGGAGPDLFAALDVTIPFADPSALLAGTEPPPPVMLRLSCGTGVLFALDTGETWGLVQFGLGLVGYLVDPRPRRSRWGADDDDAR